MKKITLLSYLKLSNLMLFIALSSASNCCYSQTIPVDFGTNSHPVPYDLFGFNGSNTLKANQSWGDMLNNTNSQTRLQDLNARVLRYPGGTLGNYWDWRRGWFLNDFFLQNGVTLPDKYSSPPPSDPWF